MRNNPYACRPTIQLQGGLSADGREAQAVRQDCVLLLDDKLRDKTDDIVRYFQHIDKYTLIKRYFCIKKCYNYPPVELFIEKLCPDKEKVISLQKGIYYILTQRILQT